MYSSRCSRNVCHQQLLGLKFERKIISVQEKKIFIRALIVNLKKNKKAINICNGVIFNVCLLRLLTCLLSLLWTLCVDHRREAAAAHVVFDNY